MHLRFRSVLTGSGGGKGLSCLALLSLGLSRVATGTPKALLLVSMVVPFLI